MKRNTHPFAGTRLALFLEKRLLELRGTKSQATIAAEAGFISPPMVAMLKSGASKLPLDRVPSLAKALDVDPAHLLLLALEQTAGDTAARAIMEICNTVVSRNEVAWLDEIRDASDRKDPPLTARARSSVRAIFGK